MTNSTLSRKNIIFGTGPLGLSVMDALVERGYSDITLVNRRGHAPEALPAGVNIVAGDATNPDSVAVLTAGTDVVFHCAQPEYHEWPEKFPPITAGILEGVSRSGAKLIFGDNLYMYGSTGGAPIREDLPYASTGRKGSTRAKMAQQLLDAHKAGKVKVAIGRGSDFFGPRVAGSAVGDVVFDAAVKGKTINVLGKIDLPHTYTYIKDFGRGLVTLSEHDAALGRAWHIPNAETISTRQFVDKVNAAAGNSSKIQPSGKAIVWLLGLFNPTMKEFRELMYEFEEPYIVDHSQFEAAFGANPTPMDQAIAETVAWYRKAQ